MPEYSLIKIEEIKKCVLIKFQDTQNIMMVLLLFHVHHRQLEQFHQEFLVYLILEELSIKEKRISINFLVHFY